MATTEQQGQPADHTTGDIYYALFRRKWLILAFTLLGCAAAGVIYFTTPAVYRSASKILVRYITDSAVFTPLASGGRVITPDRYGANIINSEVEILSSRDLVERTVDRIGLDNFQRLEGGDRLGIVVSVARNLHVDVPKRSNIILVYFDGPTPQLAKDVLGNLIDVYLEKHIETHRAVGAYEFLSQQTDQLRSRLADTEEELRKIKSEAGVASIEETQKMLTVRLEDLYREQREAESLLAVARARMKIMTPPPAPAAPAAETAAGEAVQPAPADADTLAKLYDRLNKLRDREIELLNTYSVDSIPVQTVRRQIEETRALMQGGDSLSAHMAGEGAATNRFMQKQSQETLVASTEAQIQVLRQYIEEAREESKKLDLLESRLTQLQRNKEIQEANYRHFSQSLEQARIEDALDARKMSNITVVQPATYPAVRYRPNLGRNISLALSLGLGIGLALALTLELGLRHAIRRPDEIESFIGLRLLAAIPWSGRWNSRSGPAKGQRAPRLLPAHEGAHAKGATASWELHNELRPHFEVLRDRVLLAIPEDAPRPQLIGVTGCESGAGVSTIASGLAVTLARNGDGRVLLVNANVDHTSASGLLNADPRTGLSGIIDLLSDGQGNTAVIQPNLYLLSASEVKGGHMPEVNASPGFKGLMQHFRQADYDFIILDMPPVHETSLAPRLARQIDGVLLVIEAERTGRETARRATQQLVESKAHLLGAVLNKKRDFVPAWLRDIA